ncbi:unnamed protein product [Xylocopa violacea]|uniref:Transposase n=1 Tax=Xylocopa violacea TaxID=135666 RepID=A0ABP1N891_XYLVO
MYRQIKEIEPGISSELNKMYEFSASTDESAAEEFPQKLAKIIEDGGYTPDQVWNVDESGLFFKKNAKQNLHSKSAEKGWWV